MTETTPNGDAAGDDVTARVLAAAKSLRDGFEERFSAIASRVKKQSEGPIKIIEMDDEIPVVMQLSVWDPKVGPVPAMLVGEAKFLATITHQEQEASTRMIDMLEPGGTCDLSRGGVNRLLLKCAIADPRARGGDTWLLVAAYYDPGIGVPKAIVEELLKEMASCWRSESPLAIEALQIRDAYNPARSRWRELLQEIRQSIWALVRKAVEAAPPVVPDIEPVATRPGADPAPARAAEEPDRDGDADLLTSIAPDHACEPVPVRITVVYPAASSTGKVLVTPRQPADSPASPKRLAAIEAGLIEVLGKLQRSGYSLKVNKEAGEATACKLVELDPGKGGLLALFLSFHARFLPHAVLHEIDGRFFAGDERVVTAPYRPSIRLAVASHLQGAEDIVYRGKSIGKVYKGRPLKPVIVPLVLVRSAIKGTGDDVPFKWVEPAPQDGIEHGHLVVAAPEIDRAEAFIMNSVRVLGPRMVALEAQHVEATEADLVKSSRSGWAATAAVCVLGGAGLLASAHLLPVEATIAILQYWYVLAGAIVLVLVAAGNLYQKLDQRVNSAIDARLHEVTSRTPLLVKPDWEVLIEAARRIGKADFGEFKAAFCQELDPLAVDETVEVVWQQDAARAGPAPKEALGALDALARSAKRPKASPVPVSNPAQLFTGGLKVTESGGAAKRKRPVDDDILSQPDEEGPATAGEAPDDLHFDPLASLKEQR